MTDLTARLTERIDWLHARTPWVGARKYLGTLREIVEIHRDRGGDCSECGDMTVYWPCPTLKTVCEAVGVGWDSDCRVNQTRQTNEGQNNGR